MRPTTSLTRAQIRTYSIYILFIVSFLLFSGCVLGVPRLSGKYRPLPIRFCLNKVPPTHFFLHSLPFLFPIVSFPFFLYLHNSCLSSSPFPPPSPPHSTFSSGSPRFLFLPFCFDRSFKEASEFPVTEYINTVPAKKHDLFLIPHGTVHCSVPPLALPSQPFSPPLPTHPTPPHPFPSRPSSSVFSCDSSDFSYVLLPLFLLLFSCRVRM